MVTKDRPTRCCRITRRCIAKYYSMRRTRVIVLKVLVDCSWNQYRNTWKYENVVPVVFGNLGASRMLPGVERDGFAHSPHYISFPLISIRDQLIKTSICHHHTVCCSEARGLRLDCWVHIILRITDLIQHGLPCFWVVLRLSGQLPRVWPPIQQHRSSHEADDALLLAGSLRYWDPLP